MASLENIINNTKNIQKYLKLNNNDQTISNINMFMDYLLLIHLFWAYYSYRQKSK